MEVNIANWRKSRAISIMVCNSEEDEFTSAVSLSSIGVDIPDKGVSDVVEVAHGDLNIALCESWLI